MIIALDWDVKNQFKQINKHNLIKEKPRFDRVDFKRAFKSDSLYLACNDIKAFSLRSPLTKVDMLFGHV